MNTDEKELLRLCGAMIDGTLDDADAQRLTEMLEADAEARATYRNIMNVHARLLLQYEEVPVIEQTTETPLTPLTPLTPETISPWWQAAAAALILFTGLNAIQSAGNLTAAKPIEPAPMEREAVTYLTQLNDALGIEPENQR